MSTTTDTPTFHQQRAAWASESLDVHQSLTASKPGTYDRSDVVADLITDLGHYADQHDLDFPALLRRGIGSWLAEKDDPDSVDRPHVDILADGVDLIASSGG
jgi:hypothetical protein